MLYSTEKAEVLRAIDEMLAKEPHRAVLRRARQEIAGDMAISGPRDDRPFHLGGCSCPPGACKRTP